MKKDFWILGVSGVGDHFHDNSVCLVRNGQVVFAASEERYSRVKHDPSFPQRALKAALDQAGIKRSDLKLYASGWPGISLAKTLFGAEKSGLVISGVSLLKNDPLKLVRVLINLSRTISFKPVARYLPKRKLIVIDHYRAHAASTYWTSGLDPCLVVVWDGFGSRLDGSLASGGVFLGEKGKIKEVEIQPLEASIGLFYEAVTNALGFVPAEGEGKTMGLAAYGDPKRFLKEMRRLAPHFQNGHWVPSRCWPDAVSSVDLKYKDFFDLTLMGRQLSKMARESARDTAAACQEIIEQEAKAYFQFLYRRYRMTNYATAGGVFLNVKMNQKLRKLPFVKNFYVQPHAGDGGVALGTALEAWQRINGAGRIRKVKTVAWGDEFSPKEIEKELKSTKGIVYQKPKDLARWVAQRLVAGKVVGWFQGRAEWGPRALGQRSVLADPRKIEIKDRINYILKRREWFMPFAPSIKEEKVKEWLVDGERSPFMTMAYNVVEGKEGKIKGAIHVDNTARPNTVNRWEQPLYWRVLDEFEKLTGVPVVLNTSFNKHGLPIVNSPKDALDHLKWGCIDELAMGPFVAKKQD